MGSHGRQGIKALILGSVAQKVLTHAKVPVLIVKS
jgi:nucleotide-binding universal stress UspA family protein